jgi:hypothetical protein
VTFITVTISEPCIPALRLAGMVPPPTKQEPDMNNAAQELKLTELEKVNGGFNISAALTGPYAPTITLTDVINSIKNQSK